MNPIFQFINQVEQMVKPVLELGKDQVHRFANHGVRLIGSVSQRMNREPQFAVGVIAQSIVLFYASIRPLVKVLDQ